MWVHQDQDWPNFIWDRKALAFKLADIRHCQGRLLGRMEVLGFESRRQASLSVLPDDVVCSAAIEGQVLGSELVRSSVALRLGINVAGLNLVCRDVVRHC